MKMKTDSAKANSNEEYYRVKVRDPYRWLEDEQSLETQEWIEDQRNKTTRFLESIQCRGEIRESLIKAYDYEKYSTPTREGDYYYYFKNIGLQNQPVLYRSKQLNGNDEEIVLDPNDINENGTVAITELSFNNNGRLLVYALSYKGSDWQEVKIRNLLTGKDLKEVLKWCKFSAFAWAEDSRGFYYSRFPDPATVAPEDESNYNRVYFHTLNTEQNEDVLIYHDDENKELAFHPTMSDDYRYLILHVWRGTTNKSQIYYRSIDDKGNFVRLLDKEDAYYSFLGNDRHVFYFYTNRFAPKGRIIAIDINNCSEESWKEVVPEQNSVISFVKLINNHFVISYMHNAHHQLKIYDRSGKHVHSPSLQSMASIINISGKRKDAEFYVNYTSFVHPPSVVKYCFKEQKVSPIFTGESVFNPEHFETKQVFYSSKDGTRVPMFITHKKGLALSGDHETLLYGYGGFGISLTPSFSPAHMMWMNNGGVYAVANIRGGGELGEEWHKGGMKENKQNVFDDFIAATEWLINNKYTNSSKMAIMGGSNGGLLVSACMNQRPDLFGAVVCQVPVTDMLRYHKFTVGRFWTTEFGSVDDNQEAFENLYSYSPLHNIKKGVNYPATIITTADKDDRVVPAHAFKYTATLQEAYSGKNPILLRAESDAGHGMGKPISKIIDEYTDIYSFLFKVLATNER